MIHKTAREIKEPTKKYWLVAGVKSISYIKTNPILSK
jgi:hypothetical protein